jgi:NADH-quinone oxidoreductase E subunit
MVMVREVVVGDTTYYYLFHATKGEHFKKFIKYLGVTLPSKEDLKKVEDDFLEMIKNSPDQTEASRKNVIELLQEIQIQKGYLPEEEIVKISKELDVPAVELCGVATFYSQFKTNPPGKYKISICRGTACHVKRSDELLRYVEELFELHEGQTSADKKFTLDIVNCLGACAKAPVMMINNEVYGELTKEKVKQIIEGLK